MTGTGDSQWISFHYKVNNATGTSRPYDERNHDGNVQPADAYYKAGEAYITVNGQPEKTRLSELNSVAGCRSKVPVELKLNRGDTNIIKFGAHGSSGMCN